MKLRQNGAQTAVLGGLLLAFTSTAHAQDNTQAGAEQEGGLDRIVVTATKREESLQDVSVSVKAFDSEAIERINPADSSELLLNVANLAINPSAGASNANIFLRGVGSTGIAYNLQSGVGVYTDEVVLNSPVVNVLQVYDLERVEVLRGPQNTLYGRNTTGGAINFITRKPEVGGEANGFITGTYGRFDQIDLIGAFGAPLGDKAAFRVALQSQNRDGIRRNVITGDDVQFRDTFAARAQLAIEPNDILSANFKGHFERVRSDNFYSKTIGTQDPNDLSMPCPTPNVLGACATFGGFVGSADPREVASDLEDSRNDVNAAGASARFELDFEQFTVTSISAYEENNQTLSLDGDATPSPDFHFFLNNEQDQISQEIRAASSSDQAIRWIVGGYFFKENLRGQAGPLFATPMGTMVVQSISEFENTSYSAYGEVEGDVTDAITLKAGLRYSSDNIKGNSAALFAFPTFLPGVDLDGSLFGGAPLPDFDVLADIAVTNGISVFTGGDFGAGPNRLIFVGGADDPTAAINDTTFENWGATAGIDVKPAEDVLVYAKWSRGFKAGRFNGAPMSIATGVGDVVVEPEILNSYEIGVKAEFADNRARVNAAFFYNDYSNQQINQFIGGEFTVINVDSEIFGGEVEINLLPLPGLFVDASAGFLDTSTKNPLGSDLIGPTLPQAPDFNANVAVRKEWELADGSLFSLGADTRYVGNRQFNLANTPPPGEPYVVVNAQASYSFGEDTRYQAMFWGKNILNNSYFIDEFDGGALIGDPATYGVTLTARF